MRNGRSFDLGTQVLNQVFYTSARFSQQAVVLIERLAQIQQPIKRSIEREAISNGDRSEVIHHGFDRRTGLIVTDVEHASFLN